MSGCVIMARNLQQNDERAELILRNGSDLDDDFSDSSLEEGRSDESDTSLLAEVSDSEKRERPLPAPDEFSVAHALAFPGNE